MRKNLIILLVLFMISSCDKSLKLKDFDKIYKRELYNIIFDTPIIKHNLVQLFDIEGKSPKVFKVLISRRDNFTRITITQIFYNFEIEELPFSYMKYKKCLFLYYNGIEMILDKPVEREELSKVLFESNIKLKDSSIYDSRILQFDLLTKDKIRINNPPINPYGESDEKNKFIPGPEKYK